MHSLFGVFTVRQTARARVRAWLLATAAGLAGNRTAAQTAGAARMEPLVRAFVMAREQDSLTRGQSREALLEFYEASGWSPAWVKDGHPTRQARAAIEFLQHSNAVGLRPDDYEPRTLDDLADRIAGPAPSLTDAAEFDVALTHGLLLLILDLSRGRVDPESLGFSLPRRTSVGAAALARTVSAADDAAATIRQAEPPYAGYRALEQQLNRYQALAADPTIRAPQRTTRPIRPGDSYDDMPALRRLLLAFGDLDSGASTVGDTSLIFEYTPPLVEAVQRFQERHGLTPDGVVGAATMAALRVPIARRVEQIELTLERWRWLDRRPPERYIAINIPAFRLYAFQRDSTAAHPDLTMKVILGASRMRRATPVFEGTMRSIVFRPYWDVPRSIAIKELIPLIRPDTGYALHQSLEIVRGSDEHARIYPITERNLGRVASGTLRLRQRPGAGNALGLVKFVFPNAHNVYLHGTPEAQLFSRARRDFSHGCIRIEDPAALAAFALGGQAEWTPSRIDAAVHADASRTVSLARPIAVFILYGTAVVDDTQRLSFFPDLYGHDAALARALARASAQRAQRAEPNRLIAEDP